MTYGAITQTDAILLETVLAEFKTRHLKFLEIGVWHGQTALGVRDFCAANKIALDYWGIDPNPIDNFAGQLVVGLSEESWNQVPTDFDVVFVDGCHCINHVILDAVHYGARIVPGGFMLFHDTAPHLQHVQTNPWIHGRENKPIHLTAVRAALRFLGWPNHTWKLWDEGYDPASDIGGLEIFRKQP